ncbi:MAG TPA: ATP-binding protein, partial [Nannocystaceae bacterium]|nr:ATP-binding protein [Nannocystaceae bacterium]
RRELEARARVEAALRVSEQRYRELLQALPVAVYSTDEHGRLVTFNDAAIGLWGRAPERGRDRFCGSVQLYTPSGAQLPAERSPLAVTLAEGRAQSRVEIVVARPDGSRRSVLAHPQPIRDDDGRLVGALDVQVDITDHRLAESELAGTRDALALQVATLTRLRELGTRLAGPLPLRSALQEILATLVQLHGADFGLITLFDALTGMLVHGASIGFEADALRELCDIAPEHGLGACGAAFADRRRVVIDDVEHDTTFDHWLPTAHAAGFRAVHSTPVITRSGDRLGVLSVHFAAPRRPTEREIQLADICARAAADTISSMRQQQTLQEADRRKDEFLAMLAHELRNPLAAMRYSLEILHMGDGDGDTLARARGSLDRQLLQMVRLIDDLLDVSRISSGKIELRRELVDLSQVLRDAVETSTAHISAAGHQLDVQLPDEPVLVDGDHARLVQVFGNLLANAAKYTPPKGHVELVLACEQGCAKVIVRDDGVGIPPAMLPNVFEMFTQVDGSKQRSQGGLGIGLGIAKRLVEMHGGTIAATSEGPGRGTAFIVRVPASVGRHPFAHEDDHADAPRTAARSLRVLVADDNEDAAEGLQILLESIGHEVRLAHDGAAALELAEAWRPDAMVLDIGMPLLTGLEVCRKVRARPWGADVVLVALTGWGQADDLKRSFEAGFDHHAVKPLDGASLAPLLARKRRASRAIELDDDDAIAGS